MNRRARRVLLAGVVSVAASLGALVAVAPAAVQTTTPGQVYIVKVTLTDKAIVIPKDKFDIGRKYPRYPRGAEIQYQFRNKGTRAYVVKMWDKTTPTIRPGQMQPLLLNWNYRGKYVYQTLHAGKPAGPRGIVTIF